MKSIISSIMVIMLLMVACNNEEPLAMGDGQNNSATSQMVDQAYFLNGELMEVEDGRVLIDTEEAGLVWVSLDQGLEVTVPLHSKVRVQFSGVIAESYPGQTTGHSLEVILPFETDVVRSYLEIKDHLLESGVDNYVWNTVKDKVAYSLEDRELDGSYKIFVASVYELEGHEIAYVINEQADLNWFYDRLEVQTSSGSYEFGPEFGGSDLVVIGQNTSVNQAEPTQAIAYDLVHSSYQDDDKNISIQYYQVKGMVGELLQDYINQSLYEIVDVYGQDYRDIRIESEVLNQDGVLTIAYKGQHLSLGYGIEKYLSIDMASSQVYTVEGIVVDLESFKNLFEEASGYDYDSLEGVEVYVVDQQYIFTFVPTDDDAERAYVAFPLLELGPLLDLDFDLPAS